MLQMDQRSLYNPSFCDLPSSVDTHGKCMCIFHCMIYLPLSSGVDTYAKLICFL